MERTSDTCRLLQQMPLRRRRLHTVFNKMATSSNLCLIVLLP